MDSPEAVGTYREVAAPLHTCCSYFLVNGIQIVRETRQGSLKALTDRHHSEILMTIAFEKCKDGPLSLANIKANTMRSTHLKKDTVVQDGQIRMVQT